MHPEDFKKTHQNKMVQQSLKYRTIICPEKHKNNPALINFNAGFAVIINTLPVNFSFFEKKLTHVYFFYLGSNIFFNRSLKSCK